MAEPELLEGARTLGIELICSGANPRRHFDPDDLVRLAESIQRHGVLEPILVRPTRLASATPREIIAGERRWRAARMAGLTRIPVLIRRRTSDETALEIALLENIQRANLDPIEEALGMQTLLDEHMWSQAELAEKLGRSLSHVNKTLALLNLPVDVQFQVRREELPRSQAVQISRLPTPAAQRSAAQSYRSGNGGGRTPSASGVLVAALKEAQAAGWAPAAAIVKAQDRDTLVALAEWIRKEAARAD